MEDQTRGQSVRRVTVERQPPPRPALWLRMSVPVGNVVQIAGLAIGAGLLALAARWHVADPLRVALMLLGWFAIYDCCHAIAHYAVGRLVGIRFRGYGLRGSDHPGDYPPGVRQAMSALPFFTAMTEKQSSQQAGSWAKATMFAAGETSTAVCSILAGLYAWLGGIPGGFALFVAMVALNAVSTVVTAITPRGDYAKALRSLRQGRA
jgi:hypothetical protein